MVEARALRLSGTATAPRWRGRIHLGALIAALPAATALCLRHPDGGDATYAAALVAAFAVSAAYHLLPVPTETRQLLRRADHCTIYLYIAGCYTPMCLTAVGGQAGWDLLAAVWAGAVAGVVLKLTGQERARVVSGTLYMALGWLGVVVLPDMVRAEGLSGLVLLCVTGLLYTAGAVVLLVRRPDPAPDTFGYHEVWHAAVVVASACYFVAVWGLAAH